MDNEQRNRNEKFSDSATGTPGNKNTGEHALPDKLTEDIATIRYKKVSC